MSGFFKKVFIALLNVAELIVIALLFTAFSLVACIVLWVKEMVFGGGR